MNTLAWVLILSGILITRAVFKGRVLHIGEDLADGFLALVQGDSKAAELVFQREGEGMQPGIVGAAVGGAIAEGAQGAIETAGKATIAAAAQALGKNAKGYRWEGVGPTYYDCSGLMWRACQAIGFKGGRFTTASMRDTGAFKTIAAPGMQGPGVINAGVNDLVLWPAGSGGITGHVGVIVGDDMFYSARSVRSGIGNAKISTFRKTRPIYLRYVGPWSGAFNSPFGGK